MIARFGALFAALLATTPAHAHDVVSGVGGFYGGLLHPLLVPTHLLALGALGLFIGQQARHHRIVLLAMLAASLLAGLVLIVAAFAATNLDIAVLGVAAVAGIGVAAARRWPIVVSSPLPLLAGAAIEFDSVPEEISMGMTFLALVGTACGAFLVAMLLVEMTVDLKRDWQKIAVRVAGSWIAASAILVLALRFAR